MNLSKSVQFICLFIMVIGLALTSFWQFGFKETLQHYAFDTLNKINPRPAMDVVKIIDIDEKSLREIGQWPWPRHIVADMVTKLKTYGVKVVVFDMVFAEEDRASPHMFADDFNVPIDALRNNDQVFVRAIDEANNVVMGFTAAPRGTTRRDPKSVAGIRIKRDDRQLFTQFSYKPTGFATNLPLLTDAAKGNGFFIAIPNDDGIIRKYQLLASYNDKLYPPLALEALRLSNGQGGNLTVKPFDKPIMHGSHFIEVGNSDLKIPTGVDSQLRIRFRPFKKDEYIPAYKVLSDQYSMPLRKQLFDKVVFIGTSAEGLKDIRSTPLNAFIAGVEVHANLYEQVLQGDYIARPAWIMKRVEAAIIICAGVIILLVSFLGAFLTCIITGVMIFGLMAATSMAYTDYGLLFDPLYPTLCILIIFMVTTVLNYIRSESQAREVKDAFGHYISPDFMEELTDNPDKLKLGGEQKELSVMFTDIRNFTSISESMTPEELIHTMNDFLTPMSDVVMGTRGTIDKFMGDAMMAFWNAPLDDADHARHAVLAALKMRAALVPVNKILAERAYKKGEIPLKLAAGIGVNTGECSVGNMGSKQRFAYSALGDAVNLASRLEGQTKAYGLDLLVGEDTVAQLSDFAFIEIDKIQVKGRAAPVRIYTALGDESVGKKTSFKKFRVAHKLFLRDYRRTNFESAIGRLPDLMQDKYGQDLKDYYEIMMQRIETFQDSPPKRPWDGVFVATSK